MSYEEWHKKFVESNPEELIAEKKWKSRFSDKKQLEKYIEILGKETPQTLEEFQNMKYNIGTEYRKLKKDYGVLSAIKKNKKITNKNAAKILYYKFKQQNKYVSDHFIEQFIAREFKKDGTANFNFEKVIEISNGEINYKDIVNNRDIRFYDDISIISERDKFITIRKGRVSKKWKKRKRRKAGE